MKPRQPAEHCKRYFSSAEHFVHHAALLQQALSVMKGAANHNRLCSWDYTAPGVELMFVYGRQAWGGAVEPQRFPARQTREASEAVARVASIKRCAAVFIQQNPAVIDQRVFHNDVDWRLAVDRYRTHHQQAFLDQARAFAELESKNLNALEQPIYPD
ncbi:N-succinylarginine dihydrolase [Vibrio metschnikovii]